jgi:hypothetical protein
MTTTYQVMDCRTGRVVATYATRARADDRAEAANQEFGAVRFRVDAVEQGFMPSDEFAAMMARVRGDRS